ncbi:MAG: hypothetical protein AB1758_31505 [Candidatus Eremiobacterota bacterium]
MIGTASEASLLSMVLSDRQQAATIQTEIQADAAKQQAQRWKILRETQTKIFELQQEVVLNQAKTAQKMHDKWSDYVRS